MEPQDSSPTDTSSNNTPKPQDNGGSNNGESKGDLEMPLALLAELSHRCPLQCPYCSNPLDLERKNNELDTQTWLRIFDEAAAMGIHQVHFSGGEPTVRADLEDMVEHAAKAGLYGNLITSAVLLDQERLDHLAKRGLEHVQISFQDTEEANADRIGGYKGGHAKKRAAARAVRAVGLPLTVNAVVHRQNIDHVGQFIEMAVELDAERVEIAQVQYYGWALKNRAAFIPTPQQLEKTTQIVEAAREQYKGVIAIDYVIPDYYAKRPKTCMGGWGRRFLNINPMGLVLPCHAAQSIPELKFDSVQDHSLEWIWKHSKAFNIYRGTDWMREPCRSCERKEIDFGGCRCQAMALTGSAENTDPACALSPLHEEIFGMAELEANRPPPEFIYRRIGAQFNSPF